MSDMNVRADAVDIEQIMRQIRARIREKRGADYTEAELQQLASVKLEKFLDPRGVRSDLVDQFRKYRVVSPEPPTYEFEDSTMYDTHRGLLRTIRRLLHPILKLFINPNPLVHALHIQKQINAEYHKRFRQREEMDPLFFEVIHNLVVELTRAGIEVQNLKMRVESLSSRMDFDERRARALEGVMQPRRPADRPSDRPSDRPGGPSRGGQGGGRPAPPAAAPPAPAPAPAAAVTPGPTASAETVHAAETTPEASAAPAGAPGAPAEGRGEGEKRRRRRRRRRRPGQTLADQQAQGAAGTGAASDDTAGGGDEGGDAGDEFEGPDEGGPDEGAPPQ